MREEYISKVIYQNITLKRRMWSTSAKNTRELREWLSSRIHIVNFEAIHPADYSHELILS